MYVLFSSNDNKTNGIRTFFVWLGSWWMMVCACVSIYTRAKNQRRDENDRTTKKQQKKCAHLLWLFQLRSMLVMVRICLCIVGDAPIGVRSAMIVYINQYQTDRCDCWGILRIWFSLDESMCIRVWAAMYAFEPMCTLNKCWWKRACFRLRNIDDALCFFLPKSKLPLCLNYNWFLFKQIMMNLVMCRKAQ